MTSDELLKRWRNQCAHSLDLSPDGEGRWHVHTPVLVAAGVPAEITIVREADGWRLTDEGQTTSELALTGFNWKTEARRAALDNMARLFGAKLEDRAVTVTCSSVGLDDIARFIQTISALGALAYSDAPKEKGAWEFRSTVGHSLRRMVGKQKTVQPDLQSKADPKGLYTADFGLIRGTYVKPSDIAPGKPAPYTTEAVLLTASSTEIAERAATKSRWWRSVDRPIDPDSLPSVTTQQQGPLSIAVVRKDVLNRSDAWGRLRDAVDGWVALDPEDVDGMDLQDELVKREIITV